MDNKDRLAWFLLGIPSGWILIMLLGFFMVEGADYSLDERRPYFRHVTVDDELYYCKRARL